jgi:hypothetical protein
MTATRSIVIASPEGDSGKSTIALGVLDLLVRQVQRVGVFRPVSRVPAGRLPDAGAAPAPANGAGGGNERDYVLEMLLEHDGVDVPYEDAGSQFHDRREIAGGRPREDLDLDVDGGEALGELDDVDVHSGRVAGAGLVQR